jgi:putative oxidoreductase
VAQIDVGYPTVTADRLASRPLVQPYSYDVPVLMLRLWLGATGIVHGYPKVFGGMEKFTEGVAKMGFDPPGLFAWAAALAEFGGGILLIVGLLTRPAAVMMAVTMFVAGFIAHGDDPFKVKELALCYLVLSLVIFLIGPGRFSLDAVLFRKREV